ncbi:hypothetical protein VE25_06325 [Devosia geojensis]|uniref:Uncharacterized protein n=1 Tax=Devosia geojensis TaxID=443610 RepID=A0A0F5FUP5_9HYPH|nr:hypothetical protein [Devosia geojensis]KKB12538.1 hypothetical protein VE25_06325 [Devosia geojensis]
MLVYGDGELQADPTELRAAVLDALSEGLAAPPGLARHQRLVGAFILAGELAQGLADARFAHAGADGWSSADITESKFLLALAKAVALSWESGFAAPPTLPSGWPELLAALAGPSPITVRRPEGYAFYALYPEAYYAAAKRSGLSSRTRIIGIRSIGTSLAAMVAASLGAGPPITLRPTGHPFERRPEISPELATHILNDPEADFAIVDEGPGLSGSSFGGVADWLVEHGIDEERLHFFPGHSGPLGPQARPEHRARWERRPRHVVDFDALILHAGRPEHQLESWLSDLLGPLQAPLEEISGGAWRKLHPAPPPPADGRLERRKFFAHADGQRFLVKFAGLGVDAERKLVRASKLAAAGFSPRPVGLCHGFLVEEWQEGTPLDSSTGDRAALIERLVDYIAFRIQHLPVYTPGADPSALAAMAVANTREALGESRAAGLEAALADIDHLPFHPVDTDNRMHAWEWLVTPNGRLLKTDALDHSGAHDLIGPQDPAWDIIGAMVELDLSSEERDALVQRIGQLTGRSIDHRLLQTMEPCYLAFQLGLWTFAAGTGDELCNEQAGRYARLLEELIEMQR